MGSFSTRTWILILLLAMLVGALFGELVKLSIAYWLADAPLGPFLTKYIEPGIAPFRLDLGILQLDFGLIFRFNFFSLLGFVLTLFAIKWAFVNRSARR